jgi:hypothetical protein
MSAKNERIAMIPGEKKRQHIKRLHGMQVLLGAACPLLDQEAPCCVNG